MKIGIIGAGKIGATAARLFVTAGHDVAISNSRGPESLRQLVHELRPKATAMSVDEIGGFAEIILLAVPWHMENALPSPERLRGKIVIDAMNPYDPAGGFFDLNATTSSKIVFMRIPV